jgi:hypothetical protein
MNNEHRTYFVCYKPDENKNEKYCRPIGVERNLRLFREDADIKHICKHIPLSLRKQVFELKYPNYKLEYFDYSGK